MGGVEAALSARPAMTVEAWQVLGLEAAREQRKERLSCWLLSQHLQMMWELLFFEWSRNCDAAVWLRLRGWRLEMQHEL